MIYLGVTIAARWKDGKAWTAMLSYVPSIIGTILVATLPGMNRVGLLFCYWISSEFSITSEQLRRTSFNVNFSPSLGRRPICDLPFVGRNVDVRSHKTCHSQRHSLDRLLSGQRRRTFHVAGQIQAKE